jgi:hypothetical protein
MVWLQSGDRRRELSERHVWVGPFLRELQKGGW